MTAAKLSATVSPLLSQGNTIRILTLITTANLPPGLVSLRHNKTKIPDSLP